MRKGSGVLSMLLLVLIKAPEIFAFLPANKLPAVSHHTSLLSLTDDESISLNFGSNGDWQVPNDFPQFLNQCTIQSFIVVVRSLRDLQTIRWVDNFTSPIFYSGEKPANIRLTGTTEATTAITSNEDVANPNGETLQILKYHGLGIMNTTLFPTWESYFSTLLEQPAESLLVTSYDGRSKDYEVEINPASLCTRIISVREQIAEEFAYDLGVVQNMGYHTMESYDEYLVIQKNATEKSAVVEIGNGAADNDDDDTNVGSKAENPIRMSPAVDGRILAPHNLEFLNYPLDSIDGITPSPLRRGNFDLMVLLATQESVVRVLNNAQQEDLGSNQVTFQKYLEEFYAERIISHFSGIQKYHRVDNFLEELLFSPPTASVDPVRLTEIVLDERRQVALEWQAMSKDVPNEHMSIRRLQLDKLMQSYS